MAPEAIFHPAIPDTPASAQWQITRGKIMPVTFSGWEKETLSWKHSAYLAANLTMPIQHLRGPEAAKLLSDYFTSNISTMKLGRCRHAIMCSENGNIMRNGIVLRISEDYFQCYTFAPLLEIIANSGKYDVEKMPEAEFNEFIYQVGGPKSLEILEQAAQEDLHDIKFMNFRNTTIAGHTVRVLRMGMAGTLGYELHGSLDDAHDVYRRIFEAGKEYGMEKLGSLSYVKCNHTENGFPQNGSHFLFAEAEHPEFKEQLGKAAAPETLRKQYTGSYSDNPAELYRNPLEFGWDNMIDFSHDFLGKEALLKIKSDGNYKRLVSLEWNAEDIMDVISSYFRKDDEPYKMIDFPYPKGRIVDSVTDQEGNVIGAAMGAVYTLYYKQMISLAVINPEYTKIGTDVTVIWGDIGGKQKKIKAKVARYPYLDMIRNENFDVESIPHIKLIK